jgi:4'-phosphopantetheinyl transferase
MTQAAIWLLDAQGLDQAALAPYLCWLGAGERERMARFRRPARARQFLLGRVLLRQALGALAGVAAPEVVLRERPGQAPQLAAPALDGAGFSLSHSATWVACAVSAGTALGVDIERLDAGRPIAALAAQAFTAAECAWLAARPPASRVRDFYVMWSTAEARIKLGVPAGGTSVLLHPALSIVLCSAAPLVRPPELVVATLVPDPAPDAR